MTNKRVLHLGCEKGELLCEVLSHGASIAIGIESQKEFAKAAIHNIEAVCLPNQHTTVLQNDWINWDEYSQYANSFDIVIWGAAFHYEKRPKLMAERIKQLLIPEGLLVMDIYLGYHFQRSWVRTPHLKYSSWLPSQQLFLDIFNGFAARWIGSSYVPKRFIYHLQPRKPMVTLVWGEKKVGKSIRAGFEVAAGAVLISVDNIINILDKELQEGSESGWTSVHSCVSEFKTVMEKEKKWNRLISHQLLLAQKLSEANLLDEFAQMITSPVTPDFDHYVIEGGILTYKDLRLRVEKELVKKGMLVWHLNSHY